VNRFLRQRRMAARRRVEVVLGETGETGETDQKCIISVLNHDFKGQMCCVCVSKECNLKWIVYLLVKHWNLLRAEIETTNYS
jgi:hypothetical protein